MSYDSSDAARDAWYEQIGAELHPGHKVDAIYEFTTERLSSYYVANPDLHLNHVIIMLKKIRRIF